MKDCTNCQFNLYAAKTFNKEQLSSMEDNCSGKTFKKGELIFKEGITCSRVSLLKEGLVKIHMVGVGGREQILKLVKAPNYIGIPNTVGDKTYHYSATAIEETQVCFIGLDNFKELLHLSKDFAYNIIADFCKNEILHFRNCIHKTQKQSAGLLADALLNFANNIYESHSFTLPLSRQEMADSFGTSRENVSRMLSEFQRDGIIKVDKKEISIVNIKRLELISGLG